MAVAASSRGTPCGVKPGCSKGPVEPRAAGSRSGGAPRLHRPAPPAAPELEQPGSCFLAYAGSGWPGPALPAPGVFLDLPLAQVYRACSVPKGIYLAASARASLSGRAPWASAWRPFRAALPPSRKRPLPLLWPSRWCRYSTVLLGRAGHGPVPLVKHYSSKMATPGKSGLLDMDEGPHRALVGGGVIRG